MPSSLNYLMEPIKEGKKRKNMLENISAGNRLTSGSSGLPELSEAQLIFRSCQKVPNCDGRGLMSR